jgi:hypothetical protein
MRFALFLIAVTSLRAQSVPQKAAADYPVHVQLGTITLAAEYMAHSLPTPAGVMITNEYLVVEAAFFGPSMSRLNMSPSHFSLRINGRGTPLVTELPGIISASIKFPGGRPDFPDRANDDNVSIGPRPPPGQRPADSQPITIAEKVREDTIDNRIRDVSLAEGQRSLPSAGMIYFPYRGKIKNIHSLELFYEGPTGKATLKLLP